MTDPYAPWQRPPLASWTICGMNHYHQGKEKNWSGLSLFVSMTRDGKCIKAEGPDRPALWDELAAQTIIVDFPKQFVLAFDPHKSSDGQIRYIFSDNYGGLVWCMLRHARVVNQHFNDQTSAMLDNLRAQPNWFKYPDLISRAIPSGVLGSEENRHYLGIAMSHVLSQNDGVWSWKVKVDQ